MPSKGWWTAGAAAVAALAGWVWLGPRGDPAVPAATAAGPGPAAGGAQFFGVTAGGPAAPEASARAARLAELRQQFELVDRTYCDYAKGTRYPHESRPVSEHPDQVDPNAPVTEAHPMRGSGGSNPNVLIQTSQSRVFMAAGESAAFSLRALDSGGTSQPLVVTRAVAQGMTFKGARATAQVALAFADDGSGADAVAGDGAFAGVLAPAQTGLASFDGTIRAEVHYTVGGKAGFVLFDVIYSPQLPATWNGPVREAVEAGSLVYYLKADIRTAGRYVVNGRVDDARGKPFALATFNDVLPTGPAEIKLTVFGKLLQDQKPAQPLTLRDVDGFLLRENTDPDRALMPRREGTVFTGKKHANADFSDAEWESEERTRHLDEFARDIALVRKAQAEFDPTLPVLKSACLP